MVDIVKKIVEIKNSLPTHVVLVGVTKYSSTEEIVEAISAGLANIGENRVEAVDKIKDLNVKKHFIGHIQSNKIRKIVENFDVIQSVSSLKHLDKIDEISSELNKKVEVFLELKISEDPNKKGLVESELDSFFSRKLRSIKISGFMAMASNTDDKDKVRSEFSEAKRIFDKYNLEHLSMGMSNDYKIAIEEGSNIIRLGSAIFK